MTSENNNRIIRLSLRLNLKIKQPLFNVQRENSKYFHLLELRGAFSGVEIDKAIFDTHPENNKKFLAKNGKFHEFIRYHKKKIIF